LRGDDGYTLLELLIVLGIMGLMVGLAAPPFVRMIGQQQRLSDLVVVRQALSGLPMRARGLQQDVVLKPKAVDAAAPPPAAASLADSGARVIELEDLPTGWRAEPLQDIRIRSDGVCSGGDVKVTDPEGRATVFELPPPLCTPVTKTQDRPPA
jgi:prepilin-type N-terminal cleavage/methylation domain-containing protein